MLTSRFTPFRRSAALAWATLAFTALLVEPAAAQSAEALLQNVLTLLTGTTARLLATIAVVLLGIAAIFGIFDWRRDLRAGAP